MIRKIHAGFSFIEIMVVIAIIGILVSIAVPSYQNYVKRAKVLEIATQMEEYMLDVGKKYLTLGVAPNHLDEYFVDSSPDANVSKIYWYGYSDQDDKRMVAALGPGMGELEDKRLWMILDNSDPTKIQWKCTTHTGFFSLAIPDEVLPSACK